MSSASSKEIIYPTGSTPSGSVLIGGVFRMKDQEGFPLSESRDIARNNGCDVDWCEYLADAGRQGIEKYDEAASDLRLLIECGADAIVDSFKVYGSVISQQNPDAGFCEVCEIIWQTKREKAPRLRVLPE